MLCYCLIFILVSRFITAIVLDASVLVILFYASIMHESRLRLMFRSVSVHPYDKEIFALLALYLRPTVKKGGFPVKLARKEIDSLL